VLLIGLASLSPVALQAQSNPETETIEIDAGARAHPFPHFWEKMFGSGRAILSLRDGYRNDNVNLSLAFRPAPEQEISAQAFKSRLDAQFDAGPGFDDRTITTVESYSIASRNRLATFWTIPPLFLGGTAAVLAHKAGDRVALAADDRLLR